MNITVIGTGYVGLVSGACFAKMGVVVTCVDVNEEKIESLKKGHIPIYEPGLSELVTKNVEKERLFFTTNIKDSLSSADIVFSCVGTPPKANGEADLSQVLSVAKSFGQNIDKYTIFVNKSTVPVGTGEQIKKIIQEELDKRNVEIAFDVVSNPEFLKEGTAIKDFMQPDRVIIGTESELAKEVMSRLYRPFLLNNFRVYFMDLLSAEMTKYAANAMLATRISFMNDIANLCDIVGANIDMVRKGIGTDERIGNKFLYAGCGYGGSCFPKDVIALIHSAEQYGYQMKVIKAVDEVNNTQKHKVVEKLKKILPELNGKVISLWGLAFKPETDDMREAPSLTIIKDLLDAGAIVKAYDPIATSECKKYVGDNIEYADDMYSALENSDALILVTEWKQFRIPQWEKVKRLLKTPIIIDGRNIYDRKEVEEFGFVYNGIGR